MKVGFNDSENKGLIFRTLEVELRNYFWNKIWNLEIGLLARGFSNFKRVFSLGSNNVMFWCFLIGYYADPEMQCQQYHVCLTPPNAFMDRKTSFLCPNGTVFSQSLLTCDWW